jgi:putative transposase
VHWKNAEFLGRACRLVGQARQSLHYRAQPKDDTAIAAPLRELAQERRRWGWRRLIIMVRRKGVQVGEHRFRRIYRGLGLQVRARRKRKVNLVRGNVVPAVTRPNGTSESVKSPTGRAPKTWAIFEHYSTKV